MLHEAHARIPRPALLVIVAHDVFVIGVRVLGEVALDEVARLLRREAQQHVQLVHVPAVQANRMPHLRLDITERDKLVRALRGSCEFGRTGQAKHQQVQHHTVVLRDEAGKLQAAQQAVRVGVRHVLVRNHHVVLRCHVVGNVVINNQAQQSVEHGQIHLLVHLLKTGLQHHHTLAVVRVPHVREVVDALAPLVHQQGGGLRV
mmetsp:Transcript_15454/g.29757  ORF Transcript_15454/g.29757 Transcript_15454/m.29757 type:complete len:203 (-) Transcript_15454:2932-3540(-)